PVAWNIIIAQVCRLCLERHSQHYLPFLTISGNGEPLGIWIGDFRSRPAKPRTLLDIVLCRLQTAQEGKVSVSESDPGLLPAHFSNLANGPMCAGIGPSALATELLGSR